LSQSDLNISNVSRSLFRAENNEALQALASLSSGATEPTTTYAYQLWADTTAGLLKQRNAANNAWIEKGELTGINWGFLKTSGGTITGDLLLSSAAIYEAEGAGVSSAATTDIWAGGDGNTVHVTGNTGPITSFGTAPQAGAWMKVIFDSTPTLTQSANLNLNAGGSDIIIEAGDFALVYADTSTQFDVFVFRKSGVPITSTQNALGQCKLSKSGANLILLPYKGNKLTINGTSQSIPAAGITLAPPATTLTLYYIYAYMNAGVMTLEASTTAHVTDATTGVEIKSGDATRTLVGMARTVTNAWVDTAAQRFVRSWFNDTGSYCSGAFTANRSTASVGAAVELSSEIRNEFLSWSGETIMCKYDGQTSAANASYTNYTSIGIDGVVLEESTCPNTTAINVLLQHNIAGGLMKNTLAEGYHYATLTGYNNASQTTTWLGGSTLSQRTNLQTILRGNS
jgi:hypothetical protein